MGGRLCHDLHGAISIYFAIFWGDSAIFLVRGTPREYSPCNLWVTWCRFVQILIKTTAFHGTLNGKSPWEGSRHLQGEPPMRPLPHGSEGFYRRGGRRKRRSYRGGEKHVHSMKGSLPHAMVG